MAEWSKFMRRHEANVFNALFYDKEYVTEEDIAELVKRVADFFHLPRPEIQSKCNTFAEVLLGKEAGQCELSYNIEMLQKVGINNKDAFTLCFIHEMAHQILFRHRFMLFSSERWVQELAADLTAGLYAEQHGLATGKFKYALSVQKHCITHPDGKLRKKIVECAGNYLEQQAVDGGKMMNMVFKMMPAFVFTHQKELEDNWFQMLEELEIPPATPHEYQIEDLPDNNLIKQTVMKYRNPKQEHDESYNR